MIDTISGPVSLFIYQYNNKHYYFFGDLHGTRKDNCYYNGMQCDAFNYNFTETMNANTNCTTIGALFHNWFVYNNSKNIKTDCYLEEHYTKENERFEDVETLNIIKNRSTINTRQGSPFKDKSWMEILPYIMSSCFVKDKLDCPYQPYVHLHYTDVRTIVTVDSVVEMTPYFLDNILIYIIENQPTSVDELTLIREEILDLISFLIKNFKILLNDLLNNDIDGYKEKLLSTQSPFIINMVNNIDYFVTDGQFKIAKELQRLKMVPFIHDQLLIFIDFVIDDILLKIKTYEQSISSSLRKYNIMKKRNILHVKGLRTGYDEFLKIVKGYYKMFINFEAIFMDIYTLSRMFIQDGEEVIVYAGAYHINRYKDFFNLFANPLLSIPYTKNKSCLTHPDLPFYIHANDFK